MEGASNGVTSRGRGGGRGVGRGRGGRGGGGGFGRGRGGGGRGGAFRGRGGRGRGRGGADGAGPHARHKPRGGKKRFRDGESTQHEDGTTDEDLEKRRAAEAYFGVSSQSGSGENGAGKKSKKEGSDKKTVSAFTTLRRSFVDAAAVAEFVRNNHENMKEKGSFFSDAKTTNMFMQAVSNQPEELYEALMGSHKPVVLAILERLLSLFSVGKVPMTPAVHEFVIRCEQHGVRGEDWSASGVVPLGENAEPSLLTARELIKRLIALDPVSRLQRQIEMAADVRDLARCVKRFESLQDKVDASDNEDEKASKDLDYAHRCQVIGKVVSKARRLLSVEETGTAGADKDDRVEEEEAGTASAAAADVEEVPAKKEAAAAAVVEMSEEDKALVRDEIAHTVLQLLVRVLEMRPPGSLSSPITKMVRFAEWALPHSLISQADHDTVLGLTDQTTEDLEAQAAQLETVMKLKAIAPNDDEELRSTVDHLWTEGEERHLEPCSVDVLSALAVAASPDTIADDVKKVVFDRLVATQQYFSKKGTPIHMPRRSMRFLNEVRNKERSAAITKMQKEEEAQEEKE